MKKGKSDGTASGNVGMVKQHLPLADMIVVKQLHAAAVNGNKQTLQRLSSTHSHCVNVEDNLGRTALMLAILTTRAECVKVLLRQGANYSLRDNRQRTALHWAAYKGSGECLQLLLASGAEWNERDGQGQTPLHLATRHSSVKCLTLLIKCLLPGEIDIQDNQKRTALHWSALYGHATHVRLLIRNGSNVGVPDINGQSPLHCAASNIRPGTIACMKLLLDECSGVVNWQDYEGQTVLHLSVFTGSEELVTTVIHAGGGAEGSCNVNTLDNMFRTPLHWAAVLGYPSITTLLLANGSDYSSSDVNGATPLHYAAQKSHAEVVEALLADETVVDEPDHDGRTAFMWAAAAGSNQVINVFIEHGVDINDVDKHGRTALHAAAISGHTDTCQLLITHDIELECQDLALRQTPFSLAAQHGQNDILKVLLKAGVNICSQDNQGQTALHWTCLSGHPSTTQLLLDASLPVDCVSYEGRTPLHCAAYAGHVTCLHLLLDNDADIDRQDTEGMTALHWCSLSGHYEVARVLVERGAFLNHVTFDEDRLTPLDCALSGEHHDISQFLMMEGAVTSTNIKNIAATKIQCVFRGHLMRKTFSKQKNLLVKHEKLKKVVARRKSQDSLQLDNVVRHLEESLDSTKDVTASLGVGQTAEAGSTGSSSLETLHLPDVSAEGGQSLWDAITPQRVLESLARERDKVLSPCPELEEEHDKDKEKGIRPSDTSKHVSFADSSSDKQTSGRDNGSIAGNQNVTKTFGRNKTHRDKKKKKASKTKAIDSNDLPNVSC